MKILHLIDSAGLYGAETVLLHLMEEQASLGLEPILASIGRPAISEKPLEAEARRRGLRVAAFRMKPGPNLPGIWKVLQYARQEGVLLLHSHGYKSNILFGLMPKRLRGLPLIATVHGYTWAGGLNRMLFYQQLDALSLRLVDRAVLVNPAMKQHPWLARQKSVDFHVVENGIPVEVRSVNQHLRQDILDFARQGGGLVAVGRISREKGSDLLLEAFAGLLAEGRNLRLVLMGEGALRSELEDRAKELGVAERLLCAGYVDNAGQYLSHFDLFVMPSLTEGLPMVLLEAMAAEVPIVATRVGGMPGVLDGGKAGVLVEARDSHALKNAITTVLDNPRAAQGRVTLAAARVRERYSSRVMAEGYLNIYRQLVPGVISRSSSAVGEPACR